MSPDLVNRLCTQLDRVEARVDALAVEQARSNTELLAEVRSVTAALDDHKRNHRRWETRMWGLAASVVGFFGVQGWKWLTKGGQ